jgi:hypothetical protein
MFLLARQQSAQDADSLIRLDIQLVIAIIGSVKIEESASDLSDALYVRKEVFKFGLIVTVDREVYEKRRMRGPTNVLHYSVERSPAELIVSLVKSIDADEHGMGRRLNRDRSVGIDDNREKTNSAGILNDMLDAVLSVMPKKRFATLQIKTSPPFPVE